MGAREYGRPQCTAEARSVAVYAVAVPLRSLVGDLATRSESLTFSWSAATLAELLRNHALRPADVLVLEVAALGPTLWNVLHELHSLHPTTVSVLIGEPDDLERLAHAVHWGLRGAVLDVRTPSTLERALRAVAAGEVWFSRRLASALIAPHADEPSNTGTDADDEVWRQLPALTERELAVLHEALQGLTNKEIARHLAISEQTVKIHVQNIFRKLRVHRRVDLMLLHGGARPAQH